MRGWESVPVPVLEAFGLAPPVHVFDTASGRAQQVRPEGPARLYVCGITPYDATHLGHAATYVAFDLLNRALRDAGHSVRYVQNVTDVDDPLLERAQATGEDWETLAERETERFRRDMEALRVLAPDAYVGAVEAIPLIVDLVERLRERGGVYDVDGDLYFAVHTDPRFGEVSHLPEAEMLRLFAERGGDPDRPGKKHPLDTLLWQTERPGEPSWPSPFGPGRPGWHAECTAIALHHLGEGIDVQGGGSDLVFPHHEMCASEAQAAHAGSDFAKAYVHTGMVAYEGEKMSKSRGNLVFVSRLRESGIDPMAVRLALLAHHYRSDWEWTDGELERAERRLAAYRAAARSADRTEAERLVGAVRSALADDLDAPAALEALDVWAAAAPGGRGNGADGPGAGTGSGTELVRTLVDARLGLAL